ncbi:Ig-like domain-containing protein [Klebsiella oxytoca]|uniref:Ig-like domain-containing protein n=1 Tax=Klebsiella oxytoca TaxID=571 RepID=UPI003990B220
MSVPNRGGGHSHDLRWRHGAGYGGCREDGRWSYTPDTLDEGDHSLCTTVTDKAGNVSERSV